MNYIYFLIYFSLPLHIGASDYTKEKSWQDRKKYAKKIINLFMKNHKN